MKNSAKQGCENMEIKMTTTDTPRTDAVQFQKKPISLSIENEMLRALSREIERELAASKAEVKRLREQLQQAVDIAEEFWNNQKQAITVYHEELADELDQLKATMNHDKK